jgi:hypothetical protein
MPDFEKSAPQVIQLFRDDRNNENSVASTKTPLFLQVLFAAEFITAITFFVEALPPIVRLIGSIAFIILSIISFVLWIPEFRQITREMSNPVNMILKGMQNQMKSMASLVFKLEVFDLETLEFVKNQYDAALKRGSTRIDLFMGPLDKIGAVPFMASIALAATKIPELLQQFRGIVPVPNAISSVIFGSAIGIILAYPFFMSIRMGFVGLEFESKALEEVIRRKKENLKSNP